MPFKLCAGQVPFKLCACITEGNRIHTKSKQGILHIANNIDHNWAQGAF